MSLSIQSTTCVLPLARIVRSRCGTGRRASSRGPLKGIRKQCRTATMIRRVHIWVGRAAYNCNLYQQTDIGSLPLHSVLLFRPDYKAVGRRKRLFTKQDIPRARSFDIKRTLPTWRCTIRISKQGSEHQSMAGSDGALCEDLKWALRVGEKRSPCGRRALRDQLLDGSGESETRLESIDRDS